MTDAVSFTIMNLEVKLYNPAHDCMHAQIEINDLIKTGTRDNINLRYPDYLFLSFIVRPCFGCITRLSVTLMGISVSAHISNV